MYPTSRNIQYATSFTPSSIPTSSSSDVQVSVMGLFTSIFLARLGQH